MTHPTTTIITTTLRAGRSTGVWNDSCDVGLTLVSTRTGDEMVFVVDHEERDSEGDVLYWRLVPAKLSQTALCSIIVFND